MTIHASTRPRTTLLRATFALLGGLVVTAIFGVLGYLWIVSRLPIMILLPILLEAIGTGLVIAWIYRRLKVRNLTVCLLIALLCGVLGAAYCQYSFLVRETFRFVEERQQQWAMIVTPGSPQYEEAVRPLIDHPFEAFDRAILYPRTKRHGLVGYIMARGPSGAVLWLIHIGVMVFLAMQFGWAEPRPLNLEPDDTP